MQQDRGKLKSKGKNIERNEEIGTEQDKLRKKWRNRGSDRGRQRWKDR